MIVEVARIGSYTLNEIDLTFFITCWKYSEEIIEKTITSVFHREIAREILNNSTIARQVRRRSITEREIILTANIKKYLENFVKLRFILYEKYGTIPLILEESRTYTTSSRCYKIHVHNPKLSIAEYEKMYERDNIFVEPFTRRFTIVLYEFERYDSAVLYIFKRHYFCDDLMKGSLRQELYLVPIDVFELFNKFMTINGEWRADFEAKSGLFLKKIGEQDPALALMCALAFQVYKELDYESRKSILSKLWKREDLISRAKFFVKIMRAMEVVS